MRGIARQVAHIVYRSLDPLLSGLIKQYVGHESDHDLLGSCDSSIHCTGGAGGIVIGVTTIRKTIAAVTLAVWCTLPAFAYKDNNAALIGKLPPPVAVASHQDRSDATYL